ncbi:MAG: 50S ribosomal protein L18 [Deltaproteobacteria bacterium]|nr:50S ribosomal protein L18 [Deltaproteobacteria bacterium]
MATTKLEARLHRKARIRRKVHGTAERPRLTVFRSARHMYAQVIDDEANAVLASASTVGKASAESAAGLKKKDRAKKVGQAVAALCKAKGITKVVFDRNGFQYHGRVMALADAAREAGLQF